MKRIFAIILAILLCISLVACGDSSEHIGEANTPSGSSIQQGRNFLDVIEDFEKHGFTNIKTEAIDDLIFGWLTEDGEVEKVTVDGDEDYSADTWVAADVEVIIYYHTFPQEDSQPEQDTNKDITSESTNPSTDQVTDVESEKLTDSEQDTPVVIPPENSTFSVKFIDVGQADAVMQP